MIDLWIVLWIISIPLLIGGFYKCIHDKLYGGIMVSLSIVLMAFSTAMLIVTIPNTTSTALDVYRGKTTMEITYRDDSTVNITALPLKSGNQLFIKIGMKRKEEIRKEEIRKAAEYQYQYAGNIAEQEAFKNGMVIGAEWADANPAWIRLVDEMPPIGVNVLTRVIKGDGTVVFQIDKRLEYEWLNLCHYDSISHWMKINFREDEERTK